MLALHSSTIIGFCRLFGHYPKPFFLVALHHSAACSPPLFLLPRLQTSSPWTQPLFVLLLTYMFSSLIPSEVLSTFLVASQNPSQASYVRLQVSCGPGATVRSHLFSDLAVGLFGGTPGPLSQQLFLPNHY